MCSLTAREILRLGCLPRSAQDKPTSKKNGICVLDKERLPDLYKSAGEAIGL